jgi:hypothetical protein
MPIFRIYRLKTADINNELLVSGDKSTIIDIDYCLQPTPIINLRCYNKSFSSSVIIRPQQEAKTKQYSVLAR